MGALSVATAILAVRLVLLIAVIGGIGLTWGALGDPDLRRLGALAIYAFAVVVPCVVLAAWRA